MILKKWQKTAIFCMICLILLAVPASAVQSVEQSLSGSIPRGSRFAVTITGIPNTPYYIWIPHTSSMTGEPHDQPPFIAGSQQGIEEDPPDGPYRIGSYRFNNGGGDTIRDDVAQSTPDMPNTQYYALVTTDRTGQATVEFRTTFNTAIRSYSVKVENPRSVDTDTLLVTLGTYGRQVPLSIEVPATAEPLSPAPTLPPTSVSLPPETITLVTLGTVPPSQPPSEMPTQKTPVPMILPYFAAGAVALTRILRR